MFLFNYLDIKEQVLLQSKRDDNDYISIEFRFKLN